MSRGFRQPEEQTQPNALRNILTGIYYRHEFGRRNSEVIADSRVLLQSLGIPESLAKRFILPGGKKTLAREIIDSIKAQPADRQRKLAPQVALFLRSKRVLPMTCIEGSFFPPCDSLGTERMVGIWNALFEFEVFALARIGVGHPVFFPIMPVNRAVLPDQEVEISQLLRLKEYKYSLLTSLEIPKEVVLDYFTTFQMQYRIQKLRAIVSNRSGKKSSQTTARVKKQDEEAWYRIPWTEAQKALMTFDFDQRSFPRGEKKIQIQNFYAEHLRPISKRKLKGDSPSWRGAETTYCNSLRRARFWIKNYRSII